MTDKILYGYYDDDHKILESAKELVSKGVFIRDVYSPFPVHGIDPVIGVKRTRLGIMAFIYGITGTTLALLCMWYMMIHDWPMNIGGKPNELFYQNIPAFIPPTFEFTVLCAAHLLGITFLLRNWMFPGQKAKNPHPRTSNDWFAVEVYLEDNSQFEENELKQLIESTGTIKFEEKNLELS